MGFQARCPNNIQTLTDSRARQPERERSNWLCVRQSHVPVQKMARDCASKGLHTTLLKRGFGSTRAFSCCCGLGPWLVQSQKLSVSASGADRIGWLIYRCKRPSSRRHMPNRKHVLVQLTLFCIPISFFTISPTIRVLC